MMTYTAMERESGRIVWACDGSGCGAVYSVEAGVLAHIQRVHEPPAVSELDELKAEFAAALHAAREEGRMQGLNTALNHVDTVRSRAGEWGTAEKATATTIWNMILEELR